MKTTTNNTTTTTTTTYRSALCAAEDTGRVLITALQNAGDHEAAARVSREVDAICEARRALPRLFAH